jgi:hypothetical protein
MEPLPGHYAMDTALHVKQLAALIGGALQLYVYPIPPETYMIIIFLFQQYYTLILSIITNYCK